MQVPEITRLHLKTITQEAISEGTITTGFRWNFTLHDIKEIIISIIYF